MPKRESPAASSQRARRTTPRTEAEDAAGRANLAKGVAMNKRRHKKAKELGLPTAGEKWALLLSGQISVRDLDDKEIKRMRVRNADGGFSGKARAMPSHIAQAFRDEAIRRAQDKIFKGLDDATQVALELLKDPDTPAAQRVKLIGMMWDRNLGKNPETVKVIGEDPWGTALREVLVDRSLDDLLTEEGA